MFLDHEDRVPFFGGTYFPNTARFGLPSFQEILRRVSDFYAERRSDLREQSRALIEALRSLEPEAEGNEIVTPRPLDDARTPSRALLRRRARRLRGGSEVSAPDEHRSSDAHLRRLCERPPARRFRSLDGRPTPCARCASEASTTTWGAVSAAIRWTSAG